jgi:non-heme chloroperoxidase
VTRLIRFAALASLMLLQAQAQDIAGLWQGTLKVGAQELRLVLHIAKDDQGAWAARLQSIDQGGFDNNMPVDAVTLHGTDLRLTIEAVRGTYEGKISAVADSIKGTWRQVLPLPLEFQRPTKETEWRDPSPHTQQFINVESNVKLEVLDWGGSGKPLVLIPGLGNTAHVFDKFAPRLSTTYHVYGITRRGFGNSSAPTPTGNGTYVADRLGDDVLAVLEALKLNRPVLVGHSLGGEELSSVGSRHPEKVAGLVYLDAGYWYAYYDKARGDFNIDLIYLQRALEQLHGANPPTDRKHLIEELLTTSLPVFEKDLQDLLKNLPDVPPGQQPGSRPTLASSAIMAGVRKYTDIHAPILAFFAVPHDSGLPLKDAAACAAADARDEAIFGTQAKAFEAGLPSAKVVRLPHANHYVFLSNEADVLREINAFVERLPR